MHKYMLERQRQRQRVFTFSGGAGFTGELGDKASGSNCGVDRLKRTQFSSEQPFQANQSSKRIRYY